MITRIPPMVWVHNLHGTGDRDPSDDSTNWKDWWEKHTNKRFKKCSCVSCLNDAEVGAHVQKDKGGNEWYIVPLCRKCNNKEDSFCVDGNNMEALC